MLCYCVTVNCGKNLEATWRKIWKANKLGWILNRGDVGGSGREMRKGEFRVGKQEGKDVLKTASHLKLVLFPV